MSRVRQACAQRASACVSRILVPSHSGAYLSNPQSPRQLSDARRRLYKCASVDTEYSYIAFKCHLDSYTRAFRRPAFLPSAARRMSFTGHLCPSIALGFPRVPSDAPRVAISTRDAHGRTRQGRFLRPLPCGRRPSSAPSLALLRDFTDPSRLASLSPSASLAGATIPLDAFIVPN